MFSFDLNFEWQPDDISTLMYNICNCQSLSLMFGCCLCVWDKYNLQNIRNDAKGQNIRTTTNEITKQTSIQP